MLQIGHCLNDFNMQRNLTGGGEMWLFFLRKQIFFLYIKSGYAATIVHLPFIPCICTVHIIVVYLYCSYYCLSPWKFGEALCLFFFWNSSYSPRRHGSYSSYRFFFLLLLLRLYFFFSFIYIYCFTDIINFTIFSQLLRCQFLISQNKIIKYETVTNHN